MIDMEAVAYVRPSHLGKNGEGRGSQISIFHNDDVLLIHRPNGLVNSVMQIDQLRHGGAGGFVDEVKHGDLRVILIVGRQEAPQFDSLLLVGWTTEKLIQPGLAGGKVTALPSRSAMQIEYRVHAGLRAGSHQSVQELSLIHI